MVDHKKILSMLRILEWRTDVYEEYGTCPICFGEDFRGHNEDCSLAVLIRELEVK